MTGRALPGLVLLAAVAATAPPAGAQSVSPAPSPAAAVAPVALPAPQDLSGALNWAGAVTVLAVAPAIAILATCFTRIVVVLGLLRQAMTTQQVPPNQVLLGLSLLITIVVMSPVLSQLHAEAWSPYSAGKLSAAGAVDAGEPILRAFLIRQISAAGNEADALLFLPPAARAKEGLTWGDVPTPALLASYVVSELKVAFLLGVKFFLPFLVVDLLVATILTSMNMILLPPVLISLPLKLLLFVLADGWTLVVGTLMKGLT